MEALKAKIIADLAAAQNHLRYSPGKAAKIDLGKDLTEEDLETLESFSSRFARFSEP